jgi:hypothetical protein
MRAITALSRRAKGARLSPPGSREPTICKAHHQGLPRPSRARQRSSKFIIKGCHAHHGHGSLQSAMALKGIDGNCATPATTAKKWRQSTHASKYFKNISKPKSQ